MVSTLPEQQTIGYIHSVETCGTVDGPGIRYVIFTQGCPLRCLYCHNLDCREPHQGKPVTVTELLHDIEHYRSYLRRGGVTVSGGEPLMQPEFVREIFEGCHDLGLHTALDTSGYVVLDVAKPVVAAADLVLLDIKSFLPDTYRRVTSVAITPTLELARYLDQIQKPTWIRFVLVPGLTDDPDNIRGLAQFVASLRNIEKVEVLPFHKMGEYKWQQLGLPYQLYDTPAASPDDVARAIAIFRDYDLTVQ
ncbi:pyruvate formate-lyase-activating protein [Parathermosynechococcus lividus]